MTKYKSDLSTADSSQARKVRFRLEQRVQWPVTSCAVYALYIAGAQAALNSVQTPEAKPLIPERPFKEHQKLTWPTEQERQRARGRRNCDLESLV